MSGKQATSTNRCQTKRRSLLRGIEIGEMDEPEGMSRIQGLIRIFHSSILLPGYRMSTQHNSSRCSAATTGIVSHTSRYLANVSKVLIPLVTTEATS